MTLLITKGELKSILDAFATEADTATIEIATNGYLVGVTKEDREITALQAEGEELLKSFE